MERQWLAYLVVAVLSIGAGVAIAGLPNNVPTNATIIPPATTIAAPSTSDAAERVTTTVREETTTTTSTTVPTASSATSTTTSSDTILPSDDLPPRSAVFTIVANGANLSGAAGRNVEQLQELGYTDIAPRNGTTVFDLTTVYFADGLDAAAARLADDLELLPDLVAPLNEAPDVLDLPEDVDLLVYIGLDRPG